MPAEPAMHEAERAVAQATLVLLAEPVPEQVASRLREAAALAIEHDISAAQLIAAATDTARTAWSLLAAMSSHPVDLTASAERILAVLESLGSGLADAYAQASVETSTAHAEVRQAFLDELLAAPPRDRADALRRRRRAARYGLEPDQPFRLVLASVGRGGTDEQLERTLLALRRASGTPPPARGQAMPLPQISDWHGRVVVLDRGDERRAASMRLAFEGLTVLPRRWVAICGPVVEKADRLAASLERLQEALRTAERVGRSGWISTIHELDLETLLSLDEDLRRLAIEAELGPLLRDPRLGTELITTLEVYFATGQNAHETARRLHVAPRTVTYRLKKIETLLHRSLDGAGSLRLAVAVFAFRLDRRRGEDRTGPRGTTA